MLNIEWGTTFENTYDWLSAIQLCSEDVDGWRLPTRFELVWAYDNNVAVFETTEFWTITEISTNFAFSVSFVDGQSLKRFKEDKLYVCCVRTVKGKDLLFFDPYV